MGRLGAASVEEELALPLACLKGCTVFERFSDVLYFVLCEGRSC